MCANLLHFTIPVGERQIGTMGEAIRVKNVMIETEITRVAVLAMITLTETGDTSTDPDLALLRLLGPQLIFPGLLNNNNRLLNLLGLIFSGQEWNQRQPL